MNLITIDEAPKKEKLQVYFIMMVDDSDTNGGGNDNETSP